MYYFTHSEVEAEKAKRPDQIFLVSRWKRGLFDGESNVNTPL